MSDSLKGNKLESIEIATNPNNLNINFSKISNLKFVAKEIFRCRLLGKMSNIHKLNKINIVLCSAKALFTDKVDFSYVDFKDSSFLKCSFRNSTFDYGAIINDYFDNCLFSKCIFFNVSITGTEFYNTTFKNCNLENMVIKSCKFFNCKFVNCITSNKLFETSLLFDCKFSRTNIELKTITENFGINSLSLDNVKIRNYSLKEKYQFLSLEQIKLEINNVKYNEIERFKFKYFISPNLLLNGDSSLDATFVIENWLILCNIPINFTEQLTMYYDFLIYLYENNSLPFYLLLKFHSMTAELAYTHQLKPDLYRSVMGVHMSLTRLVEEFLDTLRMTTMSQKHSTLRILANGPVNVQYYEKHLGHLLSNSSLKLEDVIIHNSPTELIFSWQTLKDITPIICLLLSLKFKAGLTHMSTKNNEMMSLREKDLRDHTDNLQLFVYEAGFSDEDIQVYQIKMKALFPGHLLLDLRLGISTKILGKLRNILLELLDPIKKS